jgi:large subunit ribosomal protein L17
MAYIELVDRPVVEDAPEVVEESVEA